MKIIGIGETVYDIIFRNGQPDKAVPGGSTFNAMISLGRTLGKEGVECLMISETGDDIIGHIITDFMRQNNVSPEYVTVHKGRKSHISLAFLNENNDAQYEFYKDHQHAEIPHHFPKVEQDDIVIFGSFFAVNPVIREMTRDFLVQAHDAGATLYYDINFRKNHREELPQIMGNIIENYQLATIVRGSKEDFEFLYGDTNDNDNDNDNQPLPTLSKGKGLKFESPSLREGLGVGSGTNVETVFTEHISPYCTTFICTDGSRPVEVWDGEHLRLPVPKISGKVVSTIGAGDNFNAGVAYALAKGMDFGRSRQETAEIVAIAQQFSSNVCQSIYNYVDEGFNAKGMINN